LGWAFLGLVRSERFKNEIPKWDEIEFYRLDDVFPSWTPIVDGVLIVSHRLLCITLPICPG
jgi:hypothetical protein